MDNDITGWFTTENGQHVPIHGGESKIQAMEKFAEKKVKVSPKKQAVIDRFKEQLNIDIEPYLEPREASKRSYIGVHLEDMNINEQNSIKSYASKHGIQIHDNGGLGHAIWL